MSKGALIIGGSVAGLQAALDLADSGINVHLVEPSAFLGANGAATVPAHLLNARLLEVAKHPNVTTWTNTRVNRAEAQSRPGRFHVELRQHPRYVDLRKCTACGDCVEVCPVTVPGTGRTAISLSAGGQPGCAAIDKLGKAPCANTCPGGIHVQGYVALIAQGRFQEAIDLIREAIPFPGICGRICTHPCEVNCRRAEVDQPVAIRLLKRFVSDWELENQVSGNQEPGTGSPIPDPRSPIPDSQRVAVVGAGPAGMTVADRLARLGYGVTVFEKLPVIGGMMAIGIPEYRLPRDVIAREYRHITDLGVEVRLDTAIGPDGAHTLDELFEMGYEAVCLAIGAHRSYTLRIPGEELPGVVQGIDLLQTISLSQQTNDPEYAADLERILHKGAATRVAVLGGGNTAMDVSRSLRRFGLEDVRILYRRTRAEMPADPEEIEDAEREGVHIQYLVSPVRILGDEEQGVTSLECQRMKLGEPDSSGRRRPVSIAGSEFVVDVDLVVLAIGQAPDLDALGDDHGLAITRHGRINVDGLSFMTSRPGVFAAGDAVTRDMGDTSPQAVIEAIGMGKKAAAEIHAYLQGQQPHEVVVDAREVAIARREMSDEELAPKPRVPVPTISMERRLSSYAEVELGYTAKQAQKEAARCLVCGPCSECLACEQVCEPGAVIHEQHERIEALEVGAIIVSSDRCQVASVKGQVSSVKCQVASDKCQVASVKWQVTSGKDAPLATSNLQLATSQDGVYRVEPDDPLAGSAAAARAMFDLFAERQPGPISARPGPADGPACVGVFVCQCGDEIAGVVDTEALRDRAARWPDVVHADVLPFSCSPEAAETMNAAIAAHDLNRVVLAACSCCAIDQVCYSCTYQRVRCKENLGIFKFQVSSNKLHDALTPTCNLQLATFELVNIREQCAWAHADDPRAATAKATALTAAAVAKVRVPAPRPVEAQRLERSALVLGSGAAAATVREALARQGIAAQRLGGDAFQLEREEGRYVVSQNGGAWRASALVLAPADEEEAERLLAGFGQNGHRPQVQAAWGGLDTHRPGIFLCPPAASTDDALKVGAAASARVAAWLGRADARAAPVAAVVDPARCRACNTCVTVCEFGAPQLVGEEPGRASWIDPLICTGCGTCAAHCPSGAIVAGYSTDAQLERMLEQVLGTRL